MKILFACDECGEDHVIDHNTKEVKHWEGARDGYDCFDRVSYEQDEIPKEVAAALNGFKWKCTKCKTEMKEESYERTRYYM